MHFFFKWRIKKVSHRHSTLELMRHQTTGRTTYIYTPPLTFEKYIIIVLLFLSFFSIVTNVHVCACACRGARVYAVYALRPCMMMFSSSVNSSVIRNSLTLSATFPCI